MTEVLIMNLAYFANYGIAGIHSTF